MPKHPFPILLSLSLVTLLCSCDTAETRNNLAKPSLNATGIAKAKAKVKAMEDARREEAEKLALLEKNLECAIEVKAKSYNAEDKTPGELVEASNSKHLRFSAAEPEREEEFFSDSKYRLFFKLEKRFMRVDITDKAANKKLASALSVVTSSSLVLKQELAKKGFSISCKEANPRPIDPAFDRSEKKWHCSGALSKDDGKSTPISFEPEGEGFTATGPKGKLAELVFTRESGGPVSIGVREPGATTFRLEASAADATGLLVLDGVFSEKDKLNARVECKRSSNGQGRGQGRGDGARQGPKRDQATEPPAPHD